MSNICKGKILGARKLRLDRGGYANRGRDYYGNVRGTSVYEVELEAQARRRSDGAPDGCRYEALTVRATSRAEAIAKARAEAGRRWGGFGRVKKRRR